MKTWGELREESGLRNHVDMVQMLDIADLEAGTAVAGAWQPPWRQSVKLHVRIVICPLRQSEAVPEAGCRWSQGCGTMWTWSRCMSQSWRRAPLFQVGAASASKGYT